MRYKDLTGMRFGRVVALSFAGTEDNGGARWAVRCDCGVCFTTSARNLLHGGTRSCGCLRRDMLRNNPGRNTKRVRI